MSFSDAEQRLSSPSSSTHRQHILFSSSAVSLFDCVDANKDDHRLPPRRRHHLFDCIDANEDDHRLPPRVLGVGHGVPTPALPLKPKVEDAIETKGRRRH
ncbi:hypothetical protein U1Q18_036168 [Sarracenia purpurea var. burkii]